MWRNLFLLLCLSCISLQAVSGGGNDLVFYEKFEYTNQTMSEMGFPDDNYSPSNFYTIAVSKDVRVVSPLYQNVSEQVTEVVPGKTAGLLSVNCMTKDFRTCKFDVTAYDSLGNVVLDEKDITTGTYKIWYHATGDYKISFYNREVGLDS